MVTGAGEEVEISAEFKTPDMLPAAQVALGETLRFGAIQMQLVARHRLHRRVWLRPMLRFWPMPSNYGATVSPLFYLPFSGQAGGPACITDGAGRAGGDLGRRC